MKINWRVRFKNKTWLYSFICFIVSSIYQFLAMFEVAPIITEDSVVRVVAMIIQLLTFAGVLIDPTTDGISDSNQAMEYTEPKIDK